jgi:phage replication O-like protein O
MANPQCEDGYTRIANEILDKLCCFRIPGEVRLIVDCIIRKTYGFNKKNDWVGNKQMIEMTGLKKGNVSRALSEAITHKVVIKSDNKLCLNKNFDEWLSFQRTVIKSDTKVIKKDNKKLSKTRDTKDNNKRQYTKDNTAIAVCGKPQSELQELIDYSKTLNFPLQGSQKLNRFNASNFLKKYGLEKAKKSVEYAVAIRGTPYAPQINDFIQLYRKIGDLIGYFQKQKGQKNEFRNFDQ